MGAVETAGSHHPHFTNRFVKVGNALKCEQHSLMTQLFSRHKTHELGIGGQIVIVAGYGLGPPPFHLSYFAVKIFHSKEAAIEGE